MHFWQIFLLFHEYYFTICHPPAGGDLLELQIVESWAPQVAIYLRM